MVEWLKWEMKPRKGGFGVGVGQLELQNQHVNSLIDDFVVSYMLRFRVRPHVRTSNRALPQMRTSF